MQNVSLPGHRHPNHTAEKDTENNFGTLMTTLAITMPWRAQNRVMPGYNKPQPIHQKRKDLPQFATT